jgi:hypothetical protein
VSTITEATFGLSHQPRMMMMDSDEFGTIGGVEGFTHGFVLA